MLRVYYLLFFFQAEDGIRDGHVTGVQTCALPISGGPGAARRCTASSLNPRMTIGQCIAEPLLAHLRDLSAAARRERVTELRSEERRVGKEYRCRVMTTQ